MCLCKIHLHARRSVNALIKLCDMQDILLNFGCYSTFFKYLQTECPETNSDVYLPWDCTPNKKIICDNQLKIWQNLKHELLPKADPNIQVNFQYFMKKDVEKNETVINKLVAENRWCNVSFILDFIDDLLPKIVHHRNLLSNFRSAFPIVLQSLSTTEICLDFSENLTLTLPQEIQSMYWGQAKTSVTIHSGLLKREGTKEYHPYFSDDLVHDQCFAYAAIKEMLSEIDVEPGSILIITGDNCCSQYKSAKNFYDLNDISDEFGITIIRIYGVASHGKNEVDAVGGVAKIAIRSAISRGTSFFNASDCVEYLREKFSFHDDPTYHFKLIESSELNDLRLKAKYIRCPTIKGSSSFQVMIFEANNDIIRVAPYLCSCEQCISMKYGSCSLFTSHKLEVGALNKVSLRNNYLPHEPQSNDTTDVITEKSLICNGTVCAIAADYCSPDTVWFVYIINSDCSYENSDSADAYGHIIPKSQPFLKCNYLERHNELREGVVYKQTHKEAYIYRETIVYPVVNMVFNYNGVQDLHFLNNKDYVEILNYVQHTSMGSLF